MDLGNLTFSARFDSDWKSMEKHQIEEHQACHTVKVKAMRLGQCMLNLPEANCPKPIV